MSDFPYREASPSLLPRWPLDPGFVTNAHELPLHRVVRSVGPISANAIVPVQQDDDGSIEPTRTHEALRRARELALVRLMQVAVSTGVNAVIGLARETVVIPGGAGPRSYVECVAYGTAVVVDRAD